MKALKCISKAKTFENSTYLCAFSLKFCKLLYFQLDLSLSLKKTAPYFIFIGTNVLPFIYQGNFSSTRYFSRFECFNHISHILKLDKIWKNANFCKLSPLLYYQVMLLKIIANDKTSIFFSYMLNWIIQQSYHSENYCWKDIIFTEYKQNYAKDYQGKMPAILNKSEMHIFCLQNFMRIGKHCFWAILNGFAVDKLLNYVKEHDIKILFS